MFFTKWKQYPIISALRKEIEIIRSITSRNINQFQKNFVFWNQHEKFYLLMNIEENLKWWVNFSFFWFIWHRMTPTWKIKQWMLSRLNFCVNSQTPRASKNKRNKPYFFTHMATVTLSFSKSWRTTNCTGRWPSGWQQKHLWSKHRL